MELLFPVRIVTAVTVGTGLVIQIIETEFGFDLLSAVVGTSCMIAVSRMHRIAIAVETERRTTVGASTSRTAMARMIAVVMWWKIQNTILECSLRFARK